MNKTIKCIQILGQKYCLDAENGEWIQNWCIPTDSQRVPHPHSHSRNHWLCCSQWDISHWQPLLGLLYWCHIFYSLAPWEIRQWFESIICTLILQNDRFGTHCEFALRWLLQNITYDISTLVQIMAWCHQATSHYLRSMSSYGITRPQRAMSSQCNLFKDRHQWMKSLGAQY